MTPYPRRDRSSSKDKNSATQGNETFRRFHACIGTGRWKLLVQGEAAPEPESKDEPEPEPESAPETEIESEPETETESAVEPGCAAGPQSECATEPESTAGATVAQLSDTRMTQLTWQILRWKAKGRRI